MVTRRRVARKAHECGSCRTEIPAGHVYLLHTMFPGNDVRDVSHPDQFKECGDCANTYGRGHLCAPWPDGQMDRYWLGDVVPSHLDPLEA